MGGLPKKEGEEVVLSFDGTSSETGAGSRPGDRVPEKSGLHTQSGKGGEGGAQGERKGNGKDILLREETEDREGEARLREFM